MLNEHDKRTEQQIKQDVRNEKYAVAFFIVLALVLGYAYLWPKY